MGPSHSYVIGSPQLHHHLSRDCHLAGRRSSDVFDPSEQRGSGTAGNGHHDVVAENPSTGALTRPCLLDRGRMMTPPSGSLCSIVAVAGRRVDAVDAQTKRFPYANADSVRAALSRALENAAAMLVV